jgi:hypothetical protein
MKSLVVKDVFISVKNINYVTNGVLDYTAKKVYYFDIYFAGSNSKRFCFDTKKERDYELDRVYNAINSA